MKGYLWYVLYYRILNNTQSLYNSYVLCEHMQMLKILAHLIDKPYKY